MTVFTGRYTRTNIPYINCEICGEEHPVTRGHCKICNLPSIFAKSTGYCYKHQPKEHTK